MTRLSGESPCLFSFSEDGWCLCEVHGWTGPREQRSRVLVCPDANNASTDIPGRQTWKVVAGMPWPASCRACGLVTEDPDAYFLPPHWDEDDLPDEARCPGTDYQFGHEARTLDDFMLISRMRT